MTEALNYFYNINIQNTKDINTYKLVSTTNNNTYLLKESEKIEDINYIFIPFINEYNLNQNKYKIIKNIYGDQVTKIQNKYCLLLKVPSSYLDNENIEDIIDFLFKNKVYINGYKVSWNRLWEDKINYLNNFILGNESKYKDIMPYIFYYMGITENCILYLKNISEYSKLPVNLSICHRRLYYPLKELYLNNPYNFVIDVFQRDISEYIKSLYYANKDYLIELEYYLKTNKINSYEASLLYIRIVYPSYFFDCLENSNIDYNAYNFKNTVEYENFIKKTYELINSYVNIQKIDWL